MVELNIDRTRPPQILDLNRVAALREWDTAGAVLRVGSGVTYTRLIGELGDRLPGLAIASRTVGSPQIRNRGTVGGNLATASPAGDGLPPLFAADAVVEVASVRGSRQIPVAEFVVGPKRNAMADDELIAAFHVAPADAPQQFAKIGTRNAMVIAVAAFGLALHPEHEQVGTGIGSAGPTPRRATEAEAFLAAELPWQSRGPVPGSVSAEFGRLVATAASPIDDVRGTAAYRLHALSVMAQRCLGWAWTAHRQEAS
jgi:CO/xanthine dehydrogenase FAD-binding subunit